MRRKIKILEVCAIDFTLKKMLLPLIDALISEGYRVEISCTPGRYSKELEKKGYSFRYVYIDRKINLLSNIKSIVELYHIMKENKYDIVHAHTPSAGVLARIAAKLSHIPIIIYTAHGFYFHENMNKLKYAFFSNLEKILGRYFTNYMFVQSKEDYFTAIRLKIIEKDRLTYIGNGINLEKFNPDRIRINKREFKSTLGIQPDAKVMTFVGRLVKEKGIIDILKSFRQIFENYKDISLLIVGDIVKNERDVETKKIIEEMLRNQEFKSRCIITGYREDIPEILKISDIFVLPSYREGLPRSIIEAMAMGLPVVTYNIRGCREEIVDGVTGIIVPPGNIKALTNAILTLYKNPELRNTMGKRGRERAKKLYNEKKVIKKQISIINKISSNLI